MIFFRKKKKEDDHVSEPYTEEEKSDSVAKTHDLELLEDDRVTHNKLITKLIQKQTKLLKKDESSYHIADVGVQFGLRFLLLDDKDTWKAHQDHWNTASVVRTTFNESQLLFFKSMNLNNDSDSQGYACENLMNQIIKFALTLEPKGRVAKMTGQSTLTSYRKLKEQIRKNPQSTELGKYELPLKLFMEAVFCNPHKLEKPLSNLKNVKVSFSTIYESFSFAYNYETFKKYVTQFLKKHEGSEEIFDVPDDVLTYIDDGTDELIPVFEWEPHEWNTMCEFMFNKPITADLDSFASVLSFISDHKKFWKDYIKLCELAGLEFYMPPAVLNFLLVFEYHLIKSKQNQAKITKISNTSKTKTECMQQFLDEYPTNWENETSTLERIFQKNSIEFTDVADDLHQFQKTAHLKKFKDSLLSDIPNYTLDDLDLLDGIQFEEFLAKLYKKMGYTAEVTKSSGDQGGDLIISKGSKKTVVQAKRYSDKVANSAVQEAVTAIRHYDCDNAMVVTTNYFTKSAIELASSNDVTLTDRDDLEGLLEEYPIPNSND